MVRVELADVPCGFRLERLSVSWKFGLFELADSATGLANPLIACTLIETGVDDPEAPWVIPGDVGLEETL